MRNIYASGIFVSFLIMWTGCGVEPDAGDAQLTATPDEPASAETTEALTATPTCNTSNIDGRADQVAVEVPWFSSSSLETDSCNMVRGTHSEAVRQLQRSLNTCYHKGLAEDADFGGHTETALRQVQTAEHIRSDGQYGPQTRDNMCHAIINDGGCRHMNEIDDSPCPRR
jgi:hypothetical protein